MAAAAAPDLAPQAASVLGLASVDESAASAGIAVGSLADSIAQTLDAPAARADAFSSDVRTQQSTPAPDVLKSLSDALGCHRWATNKQFEWSRNPYQHRFVYTRYYFEVLVLVDIWPNATLETRKDVERKRATISAENKRRTGLGIKPIGYLPLVRGAVVPIEAFEQVRAGRVLALIEKARAEVVA